MTMAGLSWWVSWVEHDWQALGEVSEAPHNRRLRLVIIRLNCIV